MKYTISFVFLFLTSLLVAQQVDMSLFHGMAPRNIGPAGMSGRVTSIDVVLDRPDEIYIGTASGGVWRSKGAGIDWEPLMDNTGTHSIGALAINQNKPDELWVGSGEGNPRNSQSSGNGVYHTQDGGKTWQHMGLEKTRNIHRVYIHPSDNKTIYIGAQGSAWNDSPDRGVYRTQDGGKNWNKILFKNNRTGVSDWVTDPRNPDKMIVALWEFRRWPWEFKSGGVGSGLHMTYDGGDTWTQLDSTNGLPAGELGRIGLALAPSDPSVVYALIESQKNALYKSIDGGHQWEKVQDKDIGNRPFYYADLAVDSENENRLYNIYSNVKVSNDGGRTFDMLLGWDKVHGDHHAWWIHPKDGNYIIDGNDGGMAISKDRGKTWRFIENLPLAQFYHIQVDNDLPYNVLGGMQDNGSWQGPGYVFRKGGIRNAYWEEVAFGDGFDVLPDTDNDRYGYGMSQGGNLYRLDFETGASRYIKPIHPTNEVLRFNWNAPIARDPHHTDRIYYGSQYVHQSDDQGFTWSIISPDLTSNDPKKQNQINSGGLTYDVTQAENHTTLICITPSSQEQGLIWTGSDDGRLQITRDGGKNWRDLSSKLPALPSGAWIPQIKINPHKNGSAYVVVNNYRQGDWTPLLYFTENYGESWKQLLHSSIDGYALSVQPDPIEPKLIFLGTEHRLYVSFDAGKTWNKWTEGYPTASTMDMAIQTREHDLVIGTFGRSAWIIDNIKPLREIAADGQKLFNEDLHVFEANPGIRAHYKQAAGTRFQGDAMFVGENRNYGIDFQVFVKDGQEKTKHNSPRDTIFVTIKDETGDTIREFSKKIYKGINKINWLMDMNGVRGPSHNVPKKGQKHTPGPLVKPGNYTAIFSYKGKYDSTRAVVQLDPRVEDNSSDLNAIYSFKKRIRANIKKAAQGLELLNRASIDLDKIKKQLDSEDNLSPKQRSQIDTLQSNITKLKELFITEKDVQGIKRDPRLITAQLYKAADYVNGATGGIMSTFGTPNPAQAAPSTSQMQYLEQVESLLFDGLEQIKLLLENEYNPFVEYIKKSPPDWIKNYSFPLKD